MLELLAFLRANGFKTFIVSGGGVEFMRVWADQVYGVPPEQVIGSSIKTRFHIKDGIPELFRLPEVNSIDDGAGKPVGIYECQSAFKGDPGPARKKNPRGSSFCSVQRRHPSAPAHGTAEPARGTAVKNGRFTSGRPQGLFLMAVSTAA